MHKISGTTKSQLYWDLAIAGKVKLELNVNLEANQIHANYLNYYNAAATAKPKPNVKWIFKKWSML